VRVLCDEQDAANLDACALPGEASSHTYLRLAAESVLPRTIMLMYRKEPLFPDWMDMGPLSPLEADNRGNALIRKGFDVKVRAVAPKPAVAKAAPAEDTEQCEECGGDIEDGQCVNRMDH
jgi:hypothetical protein